MMWIAVAVISICVSAFMALQAQLRHIRKLQEIEAQGEARAIEARTTERLFEKEAQSGNVIGEVELEVAKKQRLEQDYKIRQVELAKSVVEAFGTRQGDLLMEAHRITVDGLLEAVARQLDNLPPNQAAILKANKRTKQQFDEAAEGRSA